MAAPGANPTSHPLTETNAYAGPVLSLVGQIGGPATAAVVSGTHVYAGIGPRLVIFTAGATPVLVGQTGVLPGVVQRIALGPPGYACVAALNGGLRVISIADSAIRPRPAPTLPVPRPTTRWMWQWWATPPTWPTTPTCASSA